MLREAQGYWVQPSVSQTLEHSQAFAGLWRWPRHYSMYFWTSRKWGKYKVWKNHSLFQICHRPGLSLCKLGSIRTSLFATCWLHIKVLIKIQFLTAVSVACLRWNSVLGNCQKIYGPASQHLHISKFLLQNILFPECPGSGGTEGTEKA